jgi:hypothetical protein
LVTDAGYEDKARSTRVSLCDAMPIGRWTWRPATAWHTTGTVVYQCTT